MYRKLISGFLMTASLSSYALETDQFIASNIVLKDSSEVMNEYFQKKIEEAVNKANQKEFKSNQCRKLAERVMTNIVGGRFSISEVSMFAKKSPLVDKYPPSSISEGEYYDISFYEHADLFMKVAPLSRTMNLNGIYMGTDKLGHFALVGRHYYRHFLDFLRKGQSVEVATENAIIQGLKSEKGMLGYAIGGTLSYGDLEANYQGFMFAKNLCEGENSYLKFDGVWKINPNRPFDTKEYFNPKMDESYNFSFWRPRLYKKIKEKLTKEYCEVLNSPMYVERMKFYQSQVSDNFNDQLIQKHILSNSKFDRKLENVKEFCK